MTADADFRTGHATVIYDAEHTIPERIVQRFNEQSLYRARIADSGNTAVGTVVLRVPAITNPLMSSEVEQALAPFGEAVRKSTVILGSPGQITIVYDPARVDADRLARAITEETRLEVTMASVQSGSETDSTGLLTPVLRYGPWVLVSLALIGVAWRVISRRLLQRPAGSGEETPAIQGGDSQR